MTNGNILSNLGKNIIICRTFIDTPALTEPIKFYVGTGTTTPDVTDTDLAAVLGSSGSFISGYPIIDETNNIVTTRCLIDTATDNGNSITEFGIFNHDLITIAQPDRLWSRAVYNVITKTAQVQIIYSEKDNF